MAPPRILQVHVYYCAMRPSHPPGLLCLKSHFNARRISATSFWTLHCLVSYVVGRPAGLHAQYIFGNSLGISKGHVSHLRQCFQQSPCHCITEDCNMSNSQLTAADSADQSTFIVTLPFLLFKPLCIWRFSRTTGVR